MATVQFPRHLLRHVDVPGECMAVGATVAEVVADLERQFPGVRAYLVDDHGALRQHVNIFIGERLLRDRERLSDPVDSDGMIHVMQALSGG
jgi:hypothetical protein